MTNKTTSAIDDYFGGDGACWVPLLALVVSIIVAVIGGLQ